MNLQKEVLHLIGNINLLKNLIHLSWKEYDWLADLVEIIDKNENPEHSYEYTKLQMFQENVFCFTPKGSVIKLPKDATPIDFAYAVHTKIGNSCYSLPN